MKKHYIIHIVLLILICLLLLKSKYFSEEIVRLRDDLNMLSIFYEKTRSRYLVSKIPLFLQEEKFVKNCNDVKCVSEGESFSGEEYKISIEFEINKNGNNFSEDKIVDEVRGFISNEMNELLCITKKMGVILKESNKVYYDNSCLLSVNIIVSKKEKATEK